MEFKEKLIELEKTINNKIELFEKDTGMSVTLYKAYNGQIRLEVKVL